MHNYPVITNSQANIFFSQFLRDRTVNSDFYQLVPEEKLDYRMVDTDERKSDSVRESIVHQIDTTRDYINGVKSGKLQFNIEYPDLRDAKNVIKDELIKKLHDTEDELFALLSDPEIKNKKISVPWSNDSISAIDALWGLDSHEILHQGWNLAVMDHLNIVRFPSLKDMWGD